jgi:hypothetical protein
LSRPLLRPRRPIIRRRAVALETHEKLAGGPLTSPAETQPGSRRAAAGVSASRCAPGAALPSELAERQADAERDDEREDKPQHECTRLRDGLRISVVRRRV